MTRPPTSLTPLSPEALLALFAGRCLGEHLLMTLLAERDTLTSRIVAEQSVDIAELQRQLWFRIGEESRKGIHSGPTETVAELLARAQEEAGSEELKSHHFLLALLRDPGSLGAVLTAAGLDLETSRRIAKEAT
ncbi:MAG TPA: Clp protease N-terminal domain-containing protein [Fimbriimonadaceae bacterium]|nr:Clp protease N-terminal domain-containing protein [Fimbriimonadaceae bacterium]